MRDTSSITSSGSRTSEIKEENEIQRYITTNDNVSHLVHELLRDAGSLGPLEQPYDLKKYKSHPFPDSSFNEKRSMEDTNRCRDIPSIGGIR